MATKDQKSKREIEAYGLWEVATKGQSYISYAKRERIMGYY